jgi:16S rRNA (cytosine1402-N4)-methyltransferase
MRTERSVHGSSYHTPVLVREVLTYLLTSPDGFYVDATAGGGGHAEAILEALSPRGRLLALDADADAVRTSTQRLMPFGDRVQVRQENFRNIRAAVAGGGERKVSGLLFDLGVSSFQLDEGSRGFSFRSDERLDMRMDRQQTLDAYAIVNAYDERQLAELLWKFGEERRSRQIAREIVNARRRQPIETTGHLASVVESVLGGRFLNKSLARVFQALRIEVNSELEQLRQALVDALDLVVQGGRVVVISYHSLEDRIVKKTFRAASATSVPAKTKLEPDRPVQARCTVLTKHPVVASEEEVSSNPRSRSAKLRAVEVLA